MTRCILAAADLGDEPSLVAAAGAQGIGIMRRCVDSADLLAAAAADPAMPVVVTAGMPRLTADAVQRMRAGNRLVIGLAVEPADEDRLRSWGVAGAIRHRGDAEASMRELALALDRGPGGVWAIDPAPQRPVRTGRVIAVWGPSGAPGRTTTVIALGEALAARGRRTCIVDADLVAPSMTAQLGVADDASGMVIACRQAEGGTLTERSLLQCTRGVLPGLAVLGGLTRAERWPDVREQPLRAVVDGLGGAFDSVVIDIGAAGAVDDTSTLLDVRRDAAAGAVIESADLVIAVSRATMLGAVRLVGEIARLPRQPDAIVLTGDPGGRVDAVEMTGVLRASGVLLPVLALPRRPDSLERAARDGALPREAASRRERRQLDAVAESLMGESLRWEPAQVRAMGARRRGRRHRGTCTRP